MGRGWGGISGFVACAGSLLPAIMSQVELSLSATSSPNNEGVRGLGMFVARSATSGYQADRLPGRSVVANTAAAAIYVQLLL